MAGYSKTPLWKKLGYKSGMTVILKGAPANYKKLLSLPASESIKWTETADSEADLVHVFTVSADELKTSLKALRTCIALDGMVWVSWPKKTAKVETDITENRVRELALPIGFVDIKVCAVDDVWSGLKLVIRKHLR
jgi:hypothetical protein